MSTLVVTIPSGTTQILQAPARSSICFQPVAGGSATVAVGPSGIAPVFTALPQSGNTSPFSVATDTYAAIMGQLGQVQVTAAGGQNCSVVISDIQNYPIVGTERQTVAMSGVAYSTPNSTAELELFSIRFPAGYFRPNFQAQLWYQISCTNNVNVKTLKLYFGNSTNSSTAGALETAAAAIQSQVYTSMAGGFGTFEVAGRNDNQTIIGSNTGLASAGGLGSSTTANVTISTANYSGTNAVEQVMMLTATKATGTDTFTLDAVRVSVFQ
jgi:hypothetical protein